jgi:Zn-dependent M16 (insulinase) family peptidase
MINNGEQESNSKYFVRLLNKYLLENRHRVHMELQPSETLEDELIAQERQYVNSVQVNLNDAEFKSIKATAQRLQDVQNTVDPPSVVNTIPSLTLGDIDKHGVEYDIIVTENAYGTDTLVTKNIAYGNAGIVYVDVGIDISSLLYTNIKMLPFIESMLSQSDTDFHSRAELDALIGMQTGGIDIDLQLLPVNDLEKTSHEASNSRKMRSILFFRGKCLAENTGNLLNLIREVAEHSKPVSQQQAVQILERKISSIEAALSTSGHSYAVSRIHARYNIQAFIDENLYGYNQLLFLKEVLGKAQNNWDFFEKRISRVMDSFNTMHSSTTFINLTGDSNSLQKIDATVEAFTLSLARDESSPKVDPSNDHPWMEKAVSKMKSLGAPIDEGIPIASQVSYVGKGGVFFEEGERISGANCVPLQYLRKGYLWENVRAKNGAYGVSTSLDNTNGFLSMVSYRDPNLSQTIDVYDNAGVYLSEEIAKKMITKDTIKTAIIGCVGDIDGSALPPRKVGWLAFRRFLSGSTATRRQKWRDEILSTTLADFEHFSTRLKKWKDKSTIVAVAPESSLSTRSWP